VDLDGKTILLTGASGGIGSVTAKELLAQGAHLIAHYASRCDDAEAACAAAPSTQSTLVQADLSQPGGARGLWREALTHRDRIDTVVINAATMPETHLDGDDAQWDEGWERTLRVNVLEPASLTRESVKHFTSHGGGTLIGLSSWAAERGSAIPHLTAYAASKAALRNLLQTIARNYAHEGVLAYVVAPGIVRTPLSEIAATYRGGIEAVNAILPMGAMVEPTEVARLIAFLATGAVPNLTGGTIDVNGASHIR
jgi:NAD(P)-dependent dehydrogenase (short-subunit alcohol dehydrogenase family)